MRVKKTRVSVAVTPNFASDGMERRDEQRPREVHSRAATLGSLAPLLLKILIVYKHVIVVSEEVPVAYVIVWPRDWFPESVTDE